MAKDQWGRNFISLRLLSQTWKVPVRIVEAACENLKIRVDQVELSKNAWIAMIHWTDAWPRVEAEVNRLVEENKMMYAQVEGG